MTKQWDGMDSGKSFCEPSWAAKLERKVSGMDRNDELRDHYWVVLRLVGDWLRLRHVPVVCEGSWLFDRLIYLVGREKLRVWLDDATE